MTSDRSDPLPRPTLARIAGLLYLILAVAGGFAQLVRSSVIEAGDAAATAVNVLDAEGWYRASIGGDLVAFSTEVVLALALYVLLRPVNSSLALLAAFLRLAQSTILAANVLNQVVALLLLRGGDTFAAFDAAQLQALALFFLEAHGYGFLIGLVFFGLHNVVLGYLVWKSGFFPRILGILLMAVVATGYLVDSVGVLLFPDYPSSLTAIVLTPAVVSEIAFIGWLLVKGASPPPDAHAAPAPAPALERIGA